MDFIALERSVTAANYDPLAGRPDGGEGRLGHGHGRAALSRHDERLFRRQPRPRASAHPQGHDGAGLPARRHQPRLSHRRSRALPGAPRSGLRPRHGPADEHRRGGRGDRHQGGAPLGLSRSRGSPRDRAEIIVAENNFHGRTTTIVGFSSDESYREGFGPFAGGFKLVPFGDAAAIEARDHRKHLRRPDRADPGRGRHRRAAGGLSAGICAPSATGTTCF